MAKTTPRWSVCWSKACPWRPSLHRSRPHLQATTKKVCWYRFAKWNRTCNRVSNQSPSRMLNPMSLLPIKLKSLKTTSSRSTRTKLWSLSTRCQHPPTSSPFKVPTTNLISYPCPSNDGSVNTVLSYWISINRWLKKLHDCSNLLILKKVASWPDNSSS